MKSILFLFLFSIVSSASAENHNHLQVNNHTNDRISVTCEDHHHKSVGSSGAISSQRTQDVPIYDNGIVHCRVLDYRGATVVRRKFNFSATSNYKWTINLAK